MGIIEFKRERLSRLSWKCMISIMQFVVYKHLRIIFFWFLAANSFVYFGSKFVENCIHVENNCLLTCLSRFAHALPRDSSITRPNSLQLQHNWLPDCPSDWPLSLPCKMLSLTAGMAYTEAHNTTTIYGQRAAPDLSRGSCPNVCFSYFELFNLLLLLLLLKFHVGIN